MQTFFFSWPDSNSVITADHLELVTPAKCNVFTTPTPCLTKQNTTNIKLFTLLSLVENSEELEIFIDFDRWDCRQRDSSREYFTEPVALTRTLLVLWTLLTPIISKSECMGWERRKLMELPNPLQRNWKRLRLESPGSSNQCLLKAH